MAAIDCCVWWLVLGVLIGWVLSWLLGRRLARAEAVEALVEKVAAPEPSAPPPAAAAPPELAPGDIDFAAASAAGFSVRGADDLVLIEGIGPRIAEMLQAGGIRTFADLAAAPMTRIQAILDQAGPNFRLARPKIWVEQAELVTQNRWTELRELQNQLVAGKRRP